VLQQHAGKVQSLPPGAQEKTLRWSPKKAGSLDLYDPPKICREFEIQIIFMLEFNFGITLNILINFSMAARLERAQKTENPQTTT
jgi:hypothetical protein